MIKKNNLWKIQMSSRWATNYFLFPTSQASWPVQVARLRVIGTSDRICILAETSTLGHDGDDDDDDDDEDEALLAITKIDFDVAFLKE